MVGGLTSRGIAAQVTLYAVIAYAADSHSAALHLEILLAIDAIADSRGDVQRQVLDGNVRSRLDAVLIVAHNVQCTIALNLELAFRVDAGLLRAAAVGQRIHGILLCTELYALRIGDVDGSA